MEVSYLIVDWPEVQRRLAAGTLVEDLLDLDGGEAWVYDCYEDESEEWCDSLMLMQAAAAAYQAMTPHLSEAVRRRADASLGLLLAPGPVKIDDLGLDDDDYYMTLGPERVAGMARDLAEIDVASWAASFDQSGREAADDEYLDDYATTQTYFDQWRRLIDKAAEMRRGIILHAG